MSVARSSGPAVSASSFHLGCCAAAARPFASTAASAVIPARPAAASAVVGDDVLEAGQLAPDLEDLVDLRLRRAEDGDGFRIAQDVFGLFGG